MINRRHIRIKVMQSCYAMLLSEGDNLNLQEKYLFESIEKLHLLYVIQYKLLIAIYARAQKNFQAGKKKYVLDHSIFENSTNFIENKVFKMLDNAVSIKNFSFKNQDLQWEKHVEIIDILWKNIWDSKILEKYLEIENPDFKTDRQFVIDVYKKIISPSDALFDFYEGEEISWVDDIPFVNTWILNNLHQLNAADTFILDHLYKDEEDKEFAKSLFRKTILNYTTYEREIQGRTPNWDADRITKIDKLLIVMAIAEFFNFPSIPTKVTINEYIELAKDYATNKSSFFINGVLDKMVLDFNKDLKIQKTGRGLL